MHSMELVSVTARELGGREQQTVDARELHAFLQVGKLFAAWIQARIEVYGFVENEDFSKVSRLPEPTSGSHEVISKTGSNSTEEVISNSGNNLGGRRFIEYTLTLDMAKELAMVERNERGRQARQYFIACEKQMYELVGQQALAASGQLAKLEAENRDLRTDLFAHRTLAESLGLERGDPGATFDLEETAWFLGMSKPKLFTLLRTFQMFRADNKPYQECIDDETFVVVAESQAGEPFALRTKFSTKGFFEFRARLHATQRLGLPGGEQAGQ